MSWTDLWKTHPTVDFRILGHDTGRFLENSSKIEQIFDEFRGVTQTDILQKLNRYSQKLMDEFSRNRSSSWVMTRQFKFRKKWMSFPDIRLCHTPENWNFGKISGWVFQDLPITVQDRPGQSDDSGNKILISFLEHSLKKNKHMPKPEKEFWE